MCFFKIKFLKEYARAENSPINKPWVALLLKSKLGTKKNTPIKIKIPTGVEDGNYMTLDSQGNEDINGQAGDLYVFFEEESHEFFSRYGNDVLLQVVLGYSQAVFGDKIDIPTINGTAKLKIPSGIQPGQILRVKGKGFPLIGKSRRGDQLVKIQIDVPSKLNGKEKKSTEDLLRIQKNKEIKFQRFED